MAALSVTPADVDYVSGSVLDGIEAAAAFDAGDVIYNDSGTNLWAKAQDDGNAMEAGSHRLGIALFTAPAAGARGSVATSGAVVDLGSAVAGTVYVIGPTAGDLLPANESAANAKVTVVGIGIGGGQILLGTLYNAGAVVPE